LNQIEASNQDTAYHGYKAKGRLGLGVMIRENEWLNDDDDNDDGKDEYDAEKRGSCGKRRNTLVFL